MAERNVPHCTGTPVIATSPSLDVLRHGWLDAVASLAPDQPELTALVEERLADAVALHRLGEDDLLDTVGEIEKAAAAAEVGDPVPLALRLRRTVYEYLLALDATPARSPAADVFTDAVTPAAAPELESPESEATAEAPETAAEAPEAEAEAAEAAAELPDAEPESPHADPPSAVDELAVEPQAEAAELAATPEPLELPDAFAAPEPADETELALPPAPADEPEPSLPLDPDEPLADATPAEARHEAAQEPEAEPPAWTPAAPEPNGTVAAAEAELPPLDWPPLGETRADAPADDSHLAPREGFHITDDVANPPHAPADDVETYAAFARPDDPPPPAESADSGWRIRRATAEARRAAEARGEAPVAPTDRPDDPFETDPLLFGERRRIQDRLRKKRCDEAAAMLQSLAQEYGGRAVAELAMDAGDRCRGLGKTNAALNCYLAASRADPIFENPLHRLADICIDDQDIELAVSYLERIARLHQMRGDERGALRVYRRIVTVAPYREDILTMLMNARNSGQLPS